MVKKFIIIWLIATVIAVVMSMFGFRVLTGEILIVYGIWLLLKGIVSRLMPKKGA